MNNEQKYDVPCPNHQDFLIVTKNTSQMLMKVLRKLKQVGFIYSSRGRGDSCGGYTLAIDPKTLTLRDVVVALEGEIFVSDCLIDHRSGRDKVDSRIHRELGTLNDMIVQELSRRSLYDTIV